MDGFSFCCVGKEIEGILSTLDDKTVLTELRKMARRLCGDKGSFSIVLLMNDGHAGVFKKDETDKMALFEVEREDIDDKAMVVCTGKKCDVQGKVECVSIVKAEDPEHTKWWLSVSECKNRCAAILNRTGVDKISMEYVPTLFRMENTKVISNVRRTFLRNDKSKNVEKEASKLRDLLGCSDVVASNSTREVYRDKYLSRDTTLLEGQVPTCGTSKLSGTVFFLGQVGYAGQPVLPV